MRKKPNAQHISTVIDLTLQHQETGGTPVEQRQTNVQKQVKPVREKRTPAKVRKVCAKTQNVAEKPGTIKRKRQDHQEGTVQQQQQQHGHGYNGLYQFDLTELIAQKLKMMLEPPMAHSSSSNHLPSYDPRTMWRRHQMMMGIVANSVPVPPYMCRIPNSSQEAVPAFHPRVRQATGRRFSIFRNVELMAQSSCAPTHQSS